MIHIFVPKRKGLSWSVIEQAKANRIAQEQAKALATNRAMIKSDIEIIRQYKTKLETLFNTGSDMNITEGFLPRAESEGKAYDSKKLYDEIINRLSVLKNSVVDMPYKFLKKTTPPAYPPVQYVHIVYSEGVMFRPSWLFYYDRFRDIMAEMKAANLTETPLYQSIVKAVDFLSYDKIKNIITAVNNMLSAYDNNTIIPPESVTQYKDGIITQYEQARKSIGEVFSETSFNNAMQSLSLIRLGTYVKLLDKFKIYDIDYAILGVDKTKQTFVDTRKPVITPTPEATNKSAVPVIAGLLALMFLQS